MTDQELEQIQKMVTVAAEEIEGRLATSMEKAIGGITEKITQQEGATKDLQAKAKAAFDNMPGIIKEHVESQLQTNLAGIVAEVGKQFEGKVKAMAGGDNSEGAGGPLSVREVLSQSDKIVNIINAWKQPTTEAAMLSQMNFVMKWHGVLSKIEKGGGSSDELNKAIAETFITQKQE